MIDVQGLLDVMAEHVAAGFAEQVVCRSSRDFAEFGHAKVSFLAPAGVKQMVATEVNEVLVSSGIRRDVGFRETGHTPRRMRNVRRAEIADQASLIPALYRARSLLDAVSSIVGEEVYVCPYEPEQYVITCLERGGDTHGWHWDDYRFALVWVIDCPPSEQGGFVECVPNTTWDKDNPDIDGVIARGTVYSLHLLPGDLYLMRTDTTLHRVFPIGQGAQRIIVNMAYASSDDLARQVTHETMDGLWSSP